MSFSPLIDDLIKALCCLPGVGPKSAQRMAFHVLEHQQEAALTLAQLLTQAINDIRHCQRCNNFSETALCTLCDNPKREAGTLCIVESPPDVMAIEQTSTFRGLYFVLMGHLSPLDGIGPKELGLDKLVHRLNTDPVEEVILATNLTVEGEATAQYITNLLRERNIHVTRIAHGVPLGGELEFVDPGTLARALQSRGQVTL